MDLPASYLQDLADSVVLTEKPRFLNAVFACCVILHDLNIVDKLHIVFSFDISDTVCDIKCLYRII